MSEPTILERPVYGVGQAASLLGLRQDRVAAWLNGYQRRGVTYPPVIREAPSTVETVTWGEFVELGFLREYRRARVSLQHIRPVIERLRLEYGVKYPLAHARPFVYGRELVLRIQDETNLDRSLAIVIRSGQELLLAPEVESYLQKVEFDDGVATRLRPAGKTSPVVIDPDFSFGRPQIRGVSTERLAELYRSGDAPEFLAEVYELPVEDIRAAVAYETQLAATAA
ncbi:MAG: DUF433 domain-containing protein [Acidimicrobiales bacterium]